MTQDKNKIKMITFNKEEIPSQCLEKKILTLKIMVLRTLILKTNSYNLLSEINFLNLLINRKILRWNIQEINTIVKYIMHPLHQNRMLKTLKMHSLPNIMSQRVYQVKKEILIFY